MKLKALVLATLVGGILGAAVYTVYESRSAPSAQAAATTLQERMGAAVASGDAAPRQHAARADLDLLTASVPAPPPLDARSFLLMDASNGQVLAARDPDARIEPASIAKLMSAFLVFHELRTGRIRLNDSVTVSEKAWRTPGSRMFIEVGKQVSVEDLIQGMIVQSGNDATVALAELVAGSEDAFVARMNDEARELGLRGTHFTNSTGLPDPELYMTARDIATLTRALIQQFPDYYRWYSQREFTFNRIRQPNRNLLLGRDASVDGVKTGHTDSAGYCLVTSAKRGDMRLISVVLGTQSTRARADASEALLNHGFRYFETRRFGTADTELAEARIWKGEAPEVPVGLHQDLVLTVARAQVEGLQTRIDLSPALTAPLGTDRAVGHMTVELDGKPVAQQPLYALREMAAGGLWRRAVDTVLLQLD